jgi:hypothetical protein
MIRRTICHCLLLFGFGLIFGPPQPADAANEAAETLTPMSAIS